MSWLNPGPQAAALPVRAGSRYGVVRGLKAHRFSKSPCKSACSVVSPDAGSRPTTHTFNRVDTKRPKDGRNPVCSAALGEARSGLRIDRQAVAGPHHTRISMRCRSRVEAPSLPSKPRANRHAVLPVQAVHFGIGNCRPLRQHNTIRFPAQPWVSRRSDAARPWRRQAESG
jgi:hypothetical protein